MSQPRQTTPSSPTPSKSSLRRTSGAQNPSQRSLIPPPSPHFEDQPPAPVRYSPRSPPNQTLEYESDDDEPLLYPEPASAAVAADSYFPFPEPERPLQPFFTLIEDVVTSEHYHPSVHYIFADDDTDIITEAALRSLEQDQHLEQSSAADAEDEAAETQSHANPTAHIDPRLPPSAPGVREHYLILDVHPIPQAQLRQQIQNQAQSQSQNTGAPDFIPSYGISSFTSLSPDWQVSSATITSAPTMGDTPDEDEGLMLRIEGRGVPPFDELDQAPSENDPLKARESLEDMIERFQLRLGEVKRLIDSDPGFPGRGVGEGAGDLSEQVHVGIGLEEQD